MGVNTGLELSNDIQYVKRVFNKYTNAYKKIKRNIKNRNKIFASRLYFIVFQFKNVFCGGNWV